VQMGPGVEISMRSKMIESQLIVSNRMLRSAAATHQVKPGLISSLRHSIGSAFHLAGASLAGGKQRPMVGDCSAVICAS
jgi:hypothetical protein